MEVLSELQPRAVFHYFEELCAIPHGSGNTKAVSDWCAAFAKARGLEYHQDALNNIINICKISLTITIVKYLNRITAQKFIGKTEICHIRSSSRTINCKKAQTGGRNIIKLTVRMR